MVLAQLLLLTVTLMKLWLELFCFRLTQGLFQKPAGRATLAAGKALGFDAGLAIRGDDDFNGLLHAAPPTWMVSLMEPSSSGCSRME